MPSRRVWFSLVLLTSFSPWALGQEGYEWLTEECPVSFNVTGVAKLPLDAGPGAKIKIVLHYEGRGRHLAVSFTHHELVALRVDNGKSTPLWPARPLADCPDHRFVITRRADRVAVVVDGQLVGRAEVKNLRGGKVGMTVSGGAALYKPLFQEVEPVYFADDFVRGDDQLGIWEPVGGEWGVKSVGEATTDTGRSVNPFSYTVKADGRALAVTGYWFWDSYLLRASVRPQAPGAIGLVVFYQDPRNYLLLRWRSEDSVSKGRARQLVVVREGKEQVHSASGATYVPGQWYQLMVKATDTHLETFIDGVPVCSLEGPPFCYGRIGLYAEGCASATFDDVVCRHWEGPTDDPSPLSERAHPPVRFSLEDTMSGWADPESDWLSGEGGWRWNKGTFWGDASLACELQRETAPEAQAELAIHADRADPRNGYLLTVTPKYDGSKLDCILYRQGSPIGQRQVVVDGWPVTVELRRHGKVVLVDVGGEQVLRVVEEHPLQGTGTGIRANGMATPAEGMFATGTNCMDDLFLTAPTEWWQGRGEWRVASRWPCQPGWTWLTGTGNSSPVLWSKRAFGGDFTVEAFVANRMDLATVPGYSHVGDLNLTVCGDGRSLSSGYSFVFAGWGNTCSALFRRTQCVARNDQPLRSTAPPAGPATAPDRAEGSLSRILLSPMNTNNNFHRHWFRLRLERRGRRIQQWVDNTLIHAYDDSAPLAAGRLALWTCSADPVRSGLVVARVRAWYEHAATSDGFPCDGLNTDTNGPWTEPSAPGPGSVLDERR